jgi:hypothetical protein
MCLLFGIPFAIYFGFIDSYLILTLSLITLSMIEIVIMSILLDQPDPDAKGIYSIIQSKNQ